MPRNEQPNVVAQTVLLPIGKIETNHGQVDGLPKNPRIIRDQQYEVLKRSIQENPEMLTYRELLVYPHNGKYVVIGGNMRLRVLKDLGEKMVPCKVLPEDTTVEQLQAYTVKDNTSGGEWDWDELANAWDEDLLKGWGLEIPTDWGGEDFGDAEFGLLNETVKNASDKCQLTILIPIEQKDNAANYIKKNGKDKLVEVVLKEIRNA